MERATSQKYKVYLSDASVSFRQTISTTVSYNDSLRFSHRAVSFGLEFLHMINSSQFDGFIFIFLLLPPPVVCYLQDVFPHVPHLVVLLQYGAVFRLGSVSHGSGHVQHRHVISAEMFKKKTLTNCLHLTHKHPGKYTQREGERKRERERGTRYIIIEESSCKRSNAA